LDLIPESIKEEHASLLDKVFQDIKEFLKMQLFPAHAVGNYRTKKDMQYGTDQTAYHRH